MSDYRILIVNLDVNASLIVFDPVSGMKNWQPVGILLTCCETSQNKLQAWLRACSS